LIKILFTSFELLNSSFKKKFLKVLLFALIGTGLEIISLLSLIPIINSVQDWDQNKKYYEIYNIIGAFFGAEIFFTVIIISIILFLIKGIYHSINIYYQNNVVFSFSNFLSNKLYEIYLKKDFLFFKSKSIPSIIKDLNNEISNVTNYVISILTLIIETIIIIGISASLFFIDFTGTLTIISSFAIFIVFYILIFKKKLAKWGDLRFILDDKIYENIFEKFEGIKDIKLNSDYDFFQKEFNDYHIEKSKLLSKHLTINQIPKVLFEILALISIGITCYIIFIITNNIQDVIVFSGILVAGSFKLIPALNKIVVSYQSIKFYIPSVKLIIEEFQSKLDNNTTNYYFNDSIEFKGVNFSFGDNNILKNVSFKILKGETIGIFGESGSGKTTLVDLICGLFSPTSGQIFVDSKELKKNSSSWFKKIAYLSQDIILKNDTILNNVINNNKLNNSKLNDALSISNLNKFINSINKGILYNVGPSGKKLSGGQKQRLAFARTYYKDSELIILDEPTSSLDIKNEKDLIKKFINKKKGKTILIISHSKLDNQIFDKVFRINGNKLSVEI